MKTLLATTALIVAITCSFSTRADEFLSELRHLGDLVSTVVLEFDGGAVICDSYSSGVTHCVTFDDNNEIVSTSWTFPNGEKFFYKPDTDEWISRWQYMQELLENDSTPKKSKGGVRKI